jgi:[acyl-carrier-protein] S-malonyltransferase
MTRAFVFPGQGSQYVGMGKALFEAHAVAREVFEEVNDVLGSNLSRIMFEGPEDDLRLTENTQPALMAVSMAVVRVLEAGDIRLGDIASHAAGHSLGEYSALAATGALSLADTARLLQIRGRAMQRAVPIGEGAMAAVLGLDFEIVEIVAQEASVEGNACSPANDNASGQVVISGHKAAVERAIGIAKDKGAKRGILLPVSAPFHCPLMQPAAEEMAEALADVQMNKPILPIIANVKADVTSAPEEIRQLLVAQVTGVVRWRESVLKMGQLGVDSLIEAGAGKVLSGLTRRINKDISAMAIETPEQIEAFAAVL